MNYIIYLIIFCLIYIIFKYLISPYIRYIHYKKYGQGLFFPIIGFLYQLNPLQNKYGDPDYLNKHYFDYADHKKNKDKLIVTNFGSQIMVLLTDTELVKEFIDKQYDYYEKYNGLGLDSLGRLVNGGLAFSERERWKKLRNNLAGAFHYDQLRSTIPVIKKLTQNKFEQLIQQNKLIKVDIIDIFKEITAETIVRTFFGENFEGKTLRGKTIPQSLSYIMENLMKQSFSLKYLIFGTYFFRNPISQIDKELNQFIQEFKNIIKEVVIAKKKEQNYQNEGVFNIIYYLKKNNLIEEITDDELVAQFITFYIGGMESTGHLMGMAAFYLTQNKKHYEILQKEIDEVNSLEYQNIQNLPYLNATIKETLRFYGPLNQLFYRKALKEHYLGNIKIFKGDVINYSGSSIHRNPKFYENPHEFLIERWINNKSGQIPYSFIPFSSGARNCIGQHLALIEAKVILSHFIKKFEFESEKDYKLKYKWGSLYQPFDNLQINLKERN